MHIKFYATFCVVEGAEDCHFATEATTLAVDFSFTLRLIDLKSVLLFDC